MLDTSRDILYLVISFCIIWITVFLCWSLYHFGRILKNANEVVEEFRMRIDALASAIDFVRHRIEQISELMTLITKGVGGYVKTAATKKAKEFFNDATDDMNDITREAVKRATSAVAKKMKKTAKKIKK